MPASGERHTLGQIGLGTSSLDQMARVLQAVRARLPLAGRGTPGTAHGLEHRDRDAEPWQLGKKGLDLRVERPFLVLEGLPADKPIDGNTFSGIDGVGDQELTWILARHHLSSAARHVHGVVGLAHSPAGAEHPIELVDSRWRKRCNRQRSDAPACSGMRVSDIVR